MEHTACCTMKTILGRLSVLTLLALIVPCSLCAEQSLDELLPVRGLCIAAPNPRQVDDFVKFIHSELAPRSVNTLILRVDYNYQYTSRPEMTNASGLSRQDVKNLVAVCRTNHIRLI